MKSLMGESQRAAKLLWNQRTLLLYTKVLYHKLYVRIFRNRKDGYDIVSMIWYSDAAGVYVAYYIR